MKIRCLGDAKGRAKLHAFKGKIKGFNTVWRKS
jgi:hypothetical protein